MDRDKDEEQLIGLEEGQLSAEQGPYPYDKLGLGNKSWFNKARQEQSLLITSGKQSAQPHIDDVRQSIREKNEKRAIIKSRVSDDQQTMSNYSKVIRPKSLEWVSLTLPSLRPDFNKLISLMIVYIHNQQLAIISLSTVSLYFTINS